MDRQTDSLHPEGSRKRGLFPRIVRKRAVGLRELCRNRCKKSFQLECKYNAWKPGIKEAAME